MARKTRWDPESIRRLPLALSEREPLSGSRSIHPEKHDYRFDMHYALELGIVRRGRMSRRYEDWERNLGPGEVWFCGMWEPHGYRITKAPCEVVVLVILPSMLANVSFEEAAGFHWLAPFAVPPARRPSVAPARRPAVRALARRIGRACKLAGESRRLWLRILLLELLLLVREDWAAPERLGEAASSFQRINRAVQMVFQSRRLLTAAEAARACKMSRNYFNELFRNLMGLSFAKFALRHRLSAAAAQLAGAPDALKSVAAEWGFTDASHLHRCFRKHYGCSPRQYRARALAGK